MAVVSGVVCIIAGLARLGFITELLSKPICYGYINGIAQLTVLTSQLPKLFELFNRRRRTVSRPLGDCQIRAWWRRKLGHILHRCGYARNHL